MAWTLRGLLDAAGVDAALTASDTGAATGVTGLAYDSRTVAAGDLFCCITGGSADGHDFAPAAVRAGAAALLVERRLEVDVPQALVGRVRPVLGSLADVFFSHPSGDLRVAGVTGTNGKTTITYLVECIAAAAGLVAGVVGNVSRRYAGIVEPAVRNTPEAIDVQALLRRMADAGTQLIALEATSEGLVAGRLRGTRFATAGFTNLTQDHLNTHGSMEAYFEAKAMLFDAEYTSRAVVNTDDAYGRTLADRIRGSLDLTTFGMSDADITCERLDLAADGTRATIRTPVGAVDIATPLVGRYNVSNCLCAIGLALDCEIGLDEIAAGIAALDRVPGRLDRVDAGQPFLALVDYAHTPDALEQALRACRELANASAIGKERGRVISVFGCGGDRDRAKRPLMGEAATRLSDLTFVTSDNPRSEDPERIVADVVEGAVRGGGPFTAIVDRTEAIAAAIGVAREGDVVLVAGKGHEQGQQFADRTIPFDDREVVRQALEALCRS